MDYVNILLSQKAMKMYNEHLKDPKYKTEICKNWEKSQNCPYNNKCRYAHGKEELMKKEAEANPNYKAKDCFNFFKYGYCNYGRRCCFKHDDRKINEETVEDDALLLLSYFNPSKSISPCSTRLSVFSELNLEEDISSELTNCNSSESLRNSNKTFSSYKSIGKKNALQGNQRKGRTTLISKSSSNSENKTQHDSLNSSEDDIEVFNTISSNLNDICDI